MHSAHTTKYPNNIAQLRGILQDLEYRQRIFKNALPALELHSEESEPTNAEPQTKLIVRRAARHW